MYRSILKINILYHLSILLSVFVFLTPISHAQTPQDTATVDIIVEADTLIPVFYQGRALPTQESNIRIIAIPHIPGVTNTKNLVYKWAYNNKVLFSGPVVGLNSIPFTAPLTNKNVISVTILNSSGTELAKKNIRLNTEKPELYFYENNTLQGISRHVVGSSYSLVGDEITVRAEPYFMSPQIFSETNLFKWQLDGRPIQNQNQNELTLRHTEGAGSSQVSLSIQNTKLLMQRASNSFKIFFESRNINQ